MSSLIQPNSFEEKFLIDAKDLLFTLKTMTLEDKSQNAVITRLQILLDNAASRLPTVFAELFCTLESVLSKDTDFLQYLNESYTICCLMQEELSAEWFKKVILNNFIFPMHCEDFPEEILLEVINSLKEEFTSDEGHPTREENLLWTSLASMITTERVLLEVVKYANVSKFDLVFYQQLALSANGNETVLLAIIDRVENIKNPDLAFSRGLKSSFYTYILTSAFPTENVVAKILEVISLKRLAPDDYYGFLHEIIHNFAIHNEPELKKKILDSVLRRINIDEVTANEDKKVMIRRIRLLATNI